MREVAEAARGGDFAGPSLDSRSVEFLDAPAGSASEVVVMFVRTAPSIQRFARVISNDVDLAAVGHLAQLGVDGGEADPLTIGSECGVQILSGLEASRARENFLNRPTLASHPDWLFGSGRHS